MNASIVMVFCILQYITLPGYSFHAIICLCYLHSYNLLSLQQKPQKNPVFGYIHFENIDLREHQHRSAENIETRRQPFVAMSRNIAVILPLF